MSTSSERPGVLPEEQGGGLVPSEWLLPDAREPEPPPVDVEALRREAEQAYDRGYAEGFAAGVEEGRRHESKRIAQAVAVAESVAEAVRASEQRWLGALEENVCALAIAVARHVVGRELRSDAQTIAELVRRAIADFPVDEPLRVRINPQDLSTLSAVSPVDGEPVAVARGRDLRWVADPEIGPGGFVVEGRERIVDGRIDLALERIYRSLIHA